MFIFSVTLTSCTASQFECDTGRCISGSGHCDGEVNCIDKTDEIQCENGNVHSINPLSV